MAEELRDWLKSECPNVWSLLNQRAQKALSGGLVEYLDGGGKSAIEAGKRNTQETDRQLAGLIGICGHNKVADAYRRDISGCATEKQVSELFCEIFLCAALAKLGENAKLRPKSGKGTSCDVAITIADHDIYGEAKRFEDTWPSVCGTISRSIVKSPPGGKPTDSRRPRYMDLQGKLRDVPNQFPANTFNILFLFHPSLGDSNEYMQQALFGEKTFLANRESERLLGDGLFAADLWRNVSACYFVRIHNWNFMWLDRWQNPRANMPVPSSVDQALARYKFNEFPNGLPEMQGT